MEFSKITSITHSFGNISITWTPSIDFVHKVENSMHHYIFFSLNDVKFLDDDVIIFSVYSVIIFGINSLKSIAIFKICTLVFFIHNVKM